MRPECPPLHDRLDALDLRPPLLLSQDFFFRVVLRVSHFDPKQESVELGFGQWIGAVVLDRILCGDNHKWARQRIRVAIDTDTSFAHCLEERALCFRGRAVDFIREHDIGEDRSAAKVKCPPGLIENRNSENIRREQIAGELDPAECAVKNRASEWARVVLPTPGTSSISRCPSASRQTSASLMASGSPRTTASIALCSC